MSGPTHAPAKQVASVGQAQSGDTLNITAGAIDSAGLDSVRANGAEQARDLSFLERISRWVDRQNLEPFVSDQSQRDGLFNQAHGQLYFSYESTQRDSLNSQLKVLEAKFEAGGISAKDEIALFELRDKISEYYNHNGMSDKDGIIPNASARPIISANMVIEYSLAMLSKLYGVNPEQTLKAKLDSSDATLSTLQDEVNKSRLAGLSTSSETLLVKTYHDLRDLYKQQVDPSMK